MANKCPICLKAFTNKQTLIDHVDKDHRDEIPEDMSITQYIYMQNHNGRKNGLCRVCGKETPWNEKTGKPYQICGSPACKLKIKQIAQERMLKVYGKKNLLSDPKHQEKMLANRKISGKYTWSDGKHVFTYTGTYEKFAIEWIDKVLGLDPETVQMPGPILPYDYNGETKYWITDMYLTEFNLVVEIKDGDENQHPGFADNRKREELKDNLMRSQKQFNYVKVTHKNMMQLASVLTDIRLNNICEEEKKQDNIISINEIYSNFIKTNEDYPINESINNGGSLELFKWMEQIKYSNFNTLQSIKETISKKSGSCHDQTYYELLVPGFDDFNKRYGLFFIEYNNENSGGMTHSLMYGELEQKYQNHLPSEYQPIGDKLLPQKYVWVENAIIGMRGLYTFNNIDELKKYISDLHADGKLGDVKKYPNLEFGKFIAIDHKPGEDLQTLVDKCCNNSIREHSSIMQEIDSDLLNEDTLPDKYFRYTCNGIGIYEALRQKVSFDIWKKLKKSNVFTWLPVPPQYEDTSKQYGSYFTAEGKKLFKTYTLPTMIKYLGADNITRKEYVIKDESGIVYRDDYQIVVVEDKRIVAEISTPIGDKRKYIDKMGVENIALLTNERSGHDKELKMILDRISTEKDHIYVLSDVHFLNPKHVDSGFDNVDDNLNNFIKVANDLIKESDMIMMLGDIVTSENVDDVKKYTKSMLTRLKCKNVVLVLGNNDNLFVKDYYDLGYMYVTDKIITDDIVFTHMPINVIGKYNIHGHIHGYDVLFNVNPDKHINVYYYALKDSPKKIMTIQDYLALYSQGGFKYLKRSNTINI